jgi:PAP2 superfamily C-terminal
MSVATLGLWIIVMSYFQLYGDALPNYPVGCGPLQDLGFVVIPNISAWWPSLGSTSSIADVWVIVSYAAFLIIVIGFLPRPMLIARRFLWLLLIVFVFRTITVVATRYPRLPFKADNYMPNNLLWGALVIFVGARKTATDMMFSGHTAGWVLTASFISRYSPYVALSNLFWLFNSLGMVLLISVREHNTSDVLVAIIVSRLAFIAYHLFLDSEYPWFYKAGFAVLDGSGESTLAMPLTVKDALGQELLIQPMSWPVTTTTKGKVLRVPDCVLRRNKGGQVVLRTNQYANLSRFSLYAWMKWLDGE